MDTHTTMDIDYNNKLFQADETFARMPVYGKWTCYTGPVKLQRIQHGRLKRFMLTDKPITVTTLWNKREFWLYTTLNVC